jgi:hypothetical protein
MNIPGALTLLLIAALSTGCANRHHPAQIDEASASTGSSVTAKAGPLGFLGRLLPRLGAQKTPPPPKATALIRVGTVKSLSVDGTYAIIKLEPGVLVQGGTELFVTATGTEPARLRAAESRPPYFLADILAGKVEPGDPVQR